MIKYELRFDRLEEAVSRLEYSFLSSLPSLSLSSPSSSPPYLIISTFSVWDSFETFQFYLDKKDEVERMTLEDFVKSVVSHAEVNLLPPKRWKIVIGNSDSDRNGDGDGDGPKS